MNLYRGSEFWPSLGQLRGARGKHVHLCPTAARFASQAGYPKL